MQTTTYQPNTTDHQNILQTLGLQEKHLREIGTRALASYTSTTDDDAIGAAGQYAYLAAVRATREFLRPVGWTRYKKKGQNIEFAALPSKNILLCTSSGDKNTGLEAEPKTKNPKGAQTQRIVNNNAQLAFSIPHRDGERSRDIRYCSRMDFPLPHFATRRRPANGTVSACGI